MNRFIVAAWEACAPLSRSEGGSAFDRTKHRARRLLVVFAGIACLTAMPIAGAATVTYELLFDVDRNGATGCSVPTPKGNVNGIEQAFVATVTTSASGASVSGIAQRTCSAGTLGPAVNVSSGGWPVGFGNGDGGTAVVELFIAKALLGTTSARVYLLSTGNGDSDAIVAGLNAGALDIALTSAAPRATAIPAQSGYVLFGLAILIGLLAAHTLRRRGPLAIVFAGCLAIAASGLAWAATVVLDGQIGDWSGVGPLATDAKGNAARNADIVALFFQHDAAYAYFRIDADIELDVALNQAPTVNAGIDQVVTLPAQANLAATASDDGLPSPATLTTAWSQVSGPGTVTFADASSANTGATFSVAGVYVVRITASDGALSTSDDVQVTVNPAAPPPTLVASAIDSTVPTTIFDSTAFLYTGPDAVQRGVASGTILARRAAVLRGNVLQQDGTPLSGVSITIVAHPEFGQTQSRADGVFDMAVNGGGLLTLRYEKAGYLPAQRQVATFPHEYVLAPGVVLLARDSRVTPIAFGTGSTAMQVARGNVVTDVDGTRQATVLFPAGTTAALVQPDGSTRAAPTLNVRLTEYTVGPRGRQAMPAELPPTSTYTYAVELGADEAVAKVDGRDVVFNQPVFLYVENFLDIPAGKIVPVGFYDPKRSTWIGAPNGRVVKITAINAGVADLDVDGDGVADGAGSLSSLGINDAERRQLASLYTAGTGLWRTPLTHFSTADTNFPYLCQPAGCTPPTEPPTPDVEQKCKGGSILGCERQTLGESVRLVGTPFVLHYDSSRVPGRIEDRTVRISVGTGGIPAGALLSEVEVLVAGRLLKEQIPSGATQHVIVWDGLDAYGRQVVGAQPLTVRVGYTYRAVRADPVPSADAWARPSGIPMSLGRDRDGSTLTLWQERIGKLTRLDARAGGLGGWTLSELHSYDALGRTLYFGDGTQQEAATMFGSASGAITTVAGGGTLTANGVPATQAALTQPWRLAAGSDGAVYFVDPVEHVVRRVGADGLIATVAGTGIAGFSGDGGPATLAKLSHPIDIAIGPDESLYIVDFDNFRVRRVSPDGIITTVAGNGSPTFSGNDGPATQAGMFVQSVAVGADGTLYLGADNRIRFVDAKGIVGTYAATGEFGFSGDRGPATQAHLGGTPEGLAVGPDGSLYFTDATRVRKVDPRGIIDTVAGSTTATFSGDGALATSAGVDPHEVAVGRDGVLYIADRGNSRIRRVGTDGIISTIAGNGTGIDVANGLATQAALPFVLGVAVASDGVLYVTDTGNGLVRRVDPVLPGLAEADIGLPSADGTSVYVLNSSGRHLRTLEGVTGALRHQVAYDGAGFPVSISDADGNVTIIERAGRTPLAIVAPGGQRTALTTNADGWLTRITDPASQSHDVEYTADGLMLRFVDPRGNASRFTYDEFGRLVRDDDAAGGSTTVARIDEPGGYTVTVTSALGRVTRYRVEGLPGGTVRRTVTEPNGLATTTLIDAAGTEETTDTSGSVITVEYGPDPRFGMQAPIVTSATFKAPSGRSLATTSTRTADLVDPADPFSALTIQDTITINGRAYTKTYSGADHTFTSATPLGRETIVTVDARGRAIGEQSPGVEPATFTYSTRGFLESIARGKGVNERKLAFAYGSDNTLQAMTDPLSATEQYVHDAAGRMTARTLANGRTIQYQYDASGNLTTVVPSGGSAHRFAYTPVELPLQYVAPGVANNTTSYTHDADREPTLVSRPDGTTVGLKYDAAGRLIGMTTAQGAYSYAYSTLSSLLTGMTAPSGVGLAYAYDGKLLLSTTWSGPVIGSVIRDYNADFRLETLTVSGTPIAFTYDDDGYVVAAGPFDLIHDAATGFLTGTVLGNVTDESTYDGFGKLASYTVRFAGSDVFKAIYTFDKRARVKTRSETVAGVTTGFEYAYDAAGRLTEVRRNGVAVSSNAYDGNGNRRPLELATPPTYDEQDRLIQFGGTNYAYAANGELTTKAAGALLTRYVYDAVGNLSRVVLPSGDAIDYLSDGMNRRVGKKVNGTLVKGFLYEDSVKVVAELDSASNVVSRFVYAEDRNTPEFMLKGGATYRIVTDHLGSPRVVIEAATGNVAQRIEYDAFGRVQSDSNPGFQPFGFAGGLYDPDTGLVRFGARDYDPEVGRWTAKDPLGLDPADPNLYTYALGDPINLTDPTGKAPTMQTAAIRAINQVQARSVSQGREYGGTIYQDGHGHHSPPEANQGTSDSVATKQEIPANSKDAARYHTHGKTQNATDEDFSEEDLKNCKKRGKPSYLGTPKGAIKVATPVKDGVVVIDIVPTPGTRPNIRFFPMR